MRPERDLLESSPGPSPAADALLLSLVPSPPRTPSPRAREAIFKYQGSQWAMLVIGIAFTLLGGLFSAIFASGAFVDAFLAIAGQEHRGVVLGSGVDTSITINDEHPTRITFTYAGPEGPAKGDSTTLDEERIAELQPGTEVEVEAAAGFARIRGLGWSAFGYFGLLVLIFPLVGVLLARAAILGNRREIRAYTEGVATMARVTHSGYDGSTKINGRHPFLVEWEFLADDGNTYQGKLSSMHRGHLEGLFDVPSIPVVYLREDPKVNTAYLP